MVSVELIRRYPFFAGLNLERITTLTRMAKEEEVEAEHFFLHEKEKSLYLYLVEEGATSAVIKVPKQDKEIVIGAIGPGGVFGWSALVPPHTATASIKATVPCKVIAIDCQQLLAVDDDHLARCRCFDAGCRRMRGHQG